MYDIDLLSRRFHWCLHLSVPKHLVSQRSTDQVTFWKFFVAISRSSLSSVPRKIISLSFLIIWCLKLWNNSCSRCSAVWDSICAWRSVPKNHTVWFILYESYIKGGYSPQVQWSTSGQLELETTAVLVRNNTWTVGKFFYTKCYSHILSEKTANAKFQRK